MHVHRFVIDIVIDIMEVNKCRACLLEKEMADLCDWYLPIEVGDTLTYLECFEMCTQLDVKNAQPASHYFRNIHYLCLDCIQELMISYRFLRKAQRSAHKLCFLSKKEDNFSNKRKNEFEYVNIREASLGDEYISISQKDQVGSLFILKFGIIININYI